MGSKRESAEDPSASPRRGLPPGAWIFVTLMAGLNVEFLLWTAATEELPVKILAFPGFWLINPPAAVFFLVCVAQGVFCPGARISLEDLAIRAQHSWASTAAGLVVLPTFVAATFWSLVVIALVKARRGQPPNRD